MTLAVITGSCIGGGAEIAIACDVRIADSTARFGITPARLGIVYPATAVERAVRVIGPAETKYLLSTAALIDPQRALRVGLVGEVHAPDALEARVDELIDLIAHRRSLLTQMASKEMVDAAAGGGAIDPEIARRWARDPRRQWRSRRGHRRVPRAARATLHLDARSRRGAGRTTILTADRQQCRAMARVPYPDPQALSPDTRAVLDKLPPLNIFRMLAGGEGLLRAFARFGDHLLSRASLDPVLREIAIVRVGVLSGASYEVHQHEGISRLLGMSDELIAAIRSGPDDPTFSEPQRQVMRFTDDVVANVKASDDTFEALAGELSLQQLQELTITIGFYMAVCRYLETFGIEIEAPG